ncbi:MAG: GntR family transcriptional regulator [Rhodospirillales bacterium]|nr:GntR family transcriptional regulator [Rhodospirillales bacterium]
MSASEDLAVGVTQNGRGGLRIRRHSLHREVIERLRDMIVEGELTPGQRIAEGKLCEEFGISRTPMREALKVLASEGLVELRPNRGTRVAKITPEEIGELFEVVSGIERMAGELATERMSDKDLERLRALNKRMEKHFENGQRHEYFKLNQQVHNMIVELAGNSVLSATHANLMVKARRARYFAIMSQDRWEESMREHGGILDAFAARDAETAGKLILKHVRKTGDVVEKTFDSDRATNGKPPLYAEK